MKTQEKKGHLIKLTHAGRFCKNDIILNKFTNVADIRVTIYLGINVIKINVIKINFIKINVILNIISYNYINVI